MFCGMDSLTKYLLKVDGITVSEFYTYQPLTLREEINYADEYAVANRISPTGVRVQKTRNDNKINGVKVMPHYGKVS